MGETRREAPQATPAPAAAQASVSIFCAFYEDAHCMVEAAKLVLTDRVWRVIAVTLVAVASIAIWSTARVFSGTVDEQSS